MKNISILISLILLSSCSWINREVGLDDDNIIEEIVEWSIEEKTGLDIDLTPSTPEHSTLKPGFTL